ncbi:MAG: MBL fold metallo-hydrolase [Kiritimatiellae bacterium]|nr:MBL fold metallo-hydrolase [Kiritimatiellia bacterium]MDD5521240.1 MBL fold metallo-hydrolase [Kiritimatiellia bacterium]
MQEVTIQGARGTIPACGDEFKRYGGNTTCYSLRTDKGIIIFDAGTGISHVKREIAHLGKTLPITLFFTHFHMDHVIGFPCFDPLYDKNARINIMADPRRRDNWKSTLKTFMGKPYWPVGLGETDIKMTLKDIPVSRDAMDVYGARVSWLSVPHPQQCLAYRIEAAGKTTIIATDIEYDLETIQTSFINFCRGADFLIFDAQYTPEEYEFHKGWGHSTWQVGARVAACAGIGRLILTHHAPARTDNELNRIIKNARNEFASTDIAMENMVLRK